MVGGINPDFGFAGPESLSNAADAVVHGLGSGQLHVRLYAAALDDATALAFLPPQSLPAAQSGRTSVDGASVTLNQPRHAWLPLLFCTCGRCCRTTRQLRYRNVILRNDCPPPSNHCLLAS